MHRRLIEAIRHGGVRNPDDRGLMPLAEARAILRGVGAFVKGEGEIHEGVGNVLASDTLWAALLSLDDVDEFVVAASRLDWQFHPRGFDNVDLHLRYGDGIVGWLETRVDAQGVVAGVPWCVLPCLFACDGVAAFALAWRCTSPPQVLRRWLDRHPDSGASCLRALDDARAAAQLRGLELRGLVPAAGGAPTVARVLATLDACAAQLGAGTAIAWPTLDGVGPRRPHGFRAIAARDGDDWSLAIERVEGERAGGVHGARVAVFRYGSRIARGCAMSARPLALAPPPGTDDVAAWLSAATVRDPDSIFGPAAAPPELPGARLVAVIPSLAHVAAEPSASAVYRALAVALAA